VSRAGVFVEPAKVVEWALGNGDSGVNVSFNEPTMLLEYAVDVFAEARRAGLHTSINTNGYLTREAIDALVEAGMEGANVDLKGGRETYRRWLAARFEYVVDAIEYLRRRGVWVEVTYLVIPGVNDDEYIEVVDAVARIGRDVPLHITRFRPDHELLDAPPTPVDRLEEVWRYARRELDFVYIGNVPGHPAQHTYCPRCGYALIRRAGDRVVEVRLRDGKCPRCGYELPMRGRVGRYGVLYRSFI